MKQRSVAVIATYLAKRPRGRIVQVRNVGDDDYIVAIEDARDGRTQLIHSVGDLRNWLESFGRGETVMPAAAICGRCNKLHVDRDVDGELMANCIPCSEALLAVAAEMFLSEVARNDP